MGRGDFPIFDASGLRAGQVIRCVIRGSPGYEGPVFGRAASLGAVRGGQKIPTVDLASQPRLG